SNVYQGAILLTAVTSLYDGLIAFGTDLSPITPYMEKLPFFAVGLGWVVPAVVGGIIGLLVGKAKE
ncbi:branched-chain amino acid transport system II carrier protein, partial [Virgibacillus sp. DJP39]|uniref:branched-chain amino acid transport system II carrier protein n=1 Tax=Virgibacillus sp. DJP39 TaxID=3409790 RepID=UPI003BB75E29